MNSVMERPETKPTLSPQSLAIIREHVQAGDEFTHAIADASGATPSEYRRLQSRWRKRQEAHQTLTVEVPPLDQAAAAAAEAARAAAEPLPDTMTMGEVRERAHNLVPDLRVATHLEMSEAFAVLARHAAELQRKAAEAKRLADDKRNAAERILLESCDVPPCPTLTALSLRRDALEKQLAEHRQTLRIADEDLPRQREIVAQIERDEISPPACRSHGFPKLRVVVAEFYDQERKKLAALVQRAAGRDAAVEAIAECERELAELSEKMLQASEAQKAKMLDPRAMSWKLD